MILIFPCDRNIVSKILNIKAKYTNLRDERRGIIMRVTKLVIGILMIVYSVWLFIQGLLGGFLGIIADKKYVSRDSWHSPLRLIYGKRDCLYFN